MTQTIASAPIAVVIPCYNHGQFLEEAVNSVAAASLRVPPDQVIIVNDGSDEAETLAALERVRESGRTVIDQPNRGVAAARNAGFQNTTTDYVLPLDADDMIAPTLLEKGLWAMATRPRTGFVCFWLRHFGNEHWIWRPHYTPYQLLFENVVTVTALVRKEAWAEAKGYAEAMRSGYEDWDFWLRLLESGWSGVQIPEPLFWYRRHNGGLLEVGNRRHHRLRERIRRQHPVLYHPDRVAELKRQYQQEDSASLLRLYGRRLAQTLLMRPQARSLRQAWRRHQEQQEPAERTGGGRWPRPWRLGGQQESACEVPSYAARAAEADSAVLVLLAPIENQEDVRIARESLRQLRSHYRIVVVPIASEADQVELETEAEELFCLENFLPEDRIFHFLSYQLQIKQPQRLVLVEADWGERLLPRLRQFHSGWEVSRVTDTRGFAGL